MDAGSRETSIGTHSIRTVVSFRIPDMTDVRRRILDQRWHRPSGLRLCLAELRGTRPAVRHAVGWLPAWDGLLFGHRFHRAEETARAEFEARVATFPLIGIPAPSRDVDLLDILPWAYGKVPDAHVGLVYAWERIVIGPRASRELVDLDRAVIAIHETLDFFDCHGTDRVSLGRRGRGSRANGFGEIVLEHDGTGRVSLSTAIHEATHLATLHSSPAHGPVFVAAVAAAYGHHYGIDVAAALDRARTMGIPAAPASWLPDIASGWFRRTAGEHRAESTVSPGPTP